MISGCRPAVRGVENRNAARDPRVPPSDRVSGGSTPRSARRRQVEHPDAGAHGGDREQQEQRHGDLVRASGLVEKPSPDEAPSNTAVIGRYILTREVLTSLGQMREGACGEIQLTDAIAAQVGSGLPVHGYRFQGERYDCGSKAGFLRATVAFALGRKDVAEDFSGFLKQMTRKDLSAGW